MKSRAQQHEISHLDPQLLSDYAFLHYNNKYDWLRLTLDEIITAYKQQPKSNAEDSSGEDSEEQEKGEEGKQETGEAEDDDEE
jgi:hypothetical protein